MPNATEKLAAAIARAKAACIEIVDLHGEVAHAYVVQYGQEHGKDHSRMFAADYEAHCKEALGAENNVIKHMRSIGLYLSGTGGQSEGQRAVTELIDGLKE
jgi:hypothetical protein